jgi:hypothetical protein
MEFVKIGRTLYVPPRGPLGSQITLIWSFLSEISPILTYKCRINTIGYVDNEKFRKNLKIVGGGKIGIPTFLGPDDQVWGIGDPQGRFSTKLDTGNLILTTKAASGYGNTEIP